MAASLARRSKPRRMDTDTTARSLALDRRQSKSEGDQRVEGSDENRRKRDVENTYIQRRAAKEQKPKPEGGEQGSSSSSSTPATGGSEKPNKAEDDQSGTSSSGGAEKPKPAGADQGGAATNG
ncbi:hypothetical protein BGW39_010662, partial [Mortierella sp. 14UC]